MLCPDCGALLVGAYCARCGRPSPPADPPPDPAEPLQPAFLLVIASLALLLACGGIALGASYVFSGSALPAPTAPPPSAGPVPAVLPESPCTQPFDGREITRVSGARTGSRVAGVEMLLRSAHDRGLIDASLGPVDGDFDRRVLQAVWEVQARAGLPVSGVIDGPTWVALRRLCAQ